MSEHTTVCDCGMPLAVHARWVGRYIRCPYCQRDYVLQANLTLLPPEEAAAAAAAASQPASAAVVPTIGRLPVSSAVPRQTAVPFDDGADLDITLTPPATSAQAEAGAPSPQIRLPAQPVPQPPPPPPARVGPSMTASPAAGAHGPHLQASRLVVELEPNHWMPMTVLIVGLLSLPATLLWGIGSLICGATALVLGSEARRYPCGTPWMRTVGMAAGAAGIALSVVYWLVIWKMSRG